MKGKLGEKQSTSDLIREMGKMGKGSNKERRKEINKYKRIVWEGKIIVRMY